MSSSCYAAFPQSGFSAWPRFASLLCCFLVQKWFGGAFFPESWWCKAPIRHMLWACLHTNPLRNCLQPSWVCAFGLVGSWPKLWSHEEAYEVYFGSKILGEARRRLKRILKKWCKWEATSSFILCAIALICGSKWKMGSIWKSPELLASVCTRLNTFEICFCFLGFFFCFFNMLANATRSELKSHFFFFFFFF